METNKKLIIVIIILSFITIASTSYTITKFILPNNSVKKEEPIDKECPKQEECPTVSQLYEKFVQNRMKYINGLGQNGQGITLFDDDLNKISSVELNNKGELYLILNSEKLINKYGDKYKGIDNVINVGVYSYGNGFGKKVISINKNGTISSIDLLNIQNNDEIIIKNHNEYKNIVNVSNTFITDGIARTVIISLTDIEGNVIPFKEY